MFPSEAGGERDGRAQKITTGAHKVHLHLLVLSSRGSLGSALPKFRGSLKDLRGDNLGRRAVDWVVQGLVAQDR